MIENFGNRGNNKNKNLKLGILVSSVAVLIAWCLIPPYNKIAQVCYWTNNVLLKVSEIQKTPYTYLYERNNAIIYAHMYPKDKKTALKMLDNVISKYSQKISANDIGEVYRDRGDLNIFYGNYQDALNDYINSGNVPYTRYFKFSMLYNHLGDTKSAEKYCNEIVNHQPSSVTGYDCFSKIYEDRNDYNASLQLWNLAIDNNRSNAEMRLERGRIKKLMGDTIGAEQDISKAKSMKSRIKVNRNPANDAIHPKKLDIPLKIKF